MGYPIKQGQTAQPVVFLLISSTDHVTGLTGATVTVTISKNGGSFGSPSGTVSEIGSGWYRVAGNATDSATLGPLLLHATATGADPCDDRFDVVAYDPQLASLGLVLAKTTNITGLNDIAATAIVSGGAITTSGGAVSNVATVATTTNLTNAATAGDFNATQKTSLNNATPTVTLATSQPNYAPATSSALATLATTVGTPAQTDQIPARFTDSTFASDGVFATAALANAPSGGGGGDPWATDLSTGGYTGTQAGNILLGGLDFDGIATDGTTGSVTLQANTPNMAGTSIMFLDGPAAGPWAVIATQSGLIATLDRTLPAAPANGNHYVFGPTVTGYSLGDNSITSAKFSAGTVNAQATGILERLLLLVARFFPAAGGSVTAPKSGTGNIVVKAAGGATIATQSVTDDGTTQTLGGAS